MVRGENEVVRAPYDSFSARGRGITSEAALASKPPRESGAVQNLGECHKPESKDFLIPLSPIMRVITPSMSHPVTCALNRIKLIAETQPNATDGALAYT
jgi:hypothetical protein